MPRGYTWHGNTLYAVLEAAFRRRQLAIYTEFDSGCEPHVNRELLGSFTPRKSLAIAFLRSK
jgi:hypothetical protein